LLARDRGERHAGGALPDGKQGLAPGAAAGGRGSSDGARRRPVTRAATATRQRRRLRGASPENRMSWRGRLRRFLPYLISAVGGFLLAYLIVAFFIFPSGVIPEDVRVPNVVGLTYAEAVR